MIWQDGPEVTKWGTVKVDPVTMTTRVPGVFAAGDCVTGGTTVIEAIAGGQRAAVNIDKLLGGPGRLPGDVGFAFTAPSEEELMAVSTTQKEKSLPVRKRKLNFHEVVLGLGPKQAVREANRCLRCDLQR
jgi:NADPH-dependent glutamate synthase beta subunit-like oxidoreductase